MKLQVKHNTTARKVALKKKKDSTGDDFFKRGVGAIQAKSSNRSNFPPGHRD